MSARTANGAAAAATSVAAVSARAAELAPIYEGGGPVTGGGRCSGGDRRVDAHDRRVRERGQLLRRVPRGRAGGRAELQHRDAADGIAPLRRDLAPLRRAVPGSGGRGDQRGALPDRVHLGVRRGTARRLRTEREDLRREEARQDAARGRPAPALRSSRLGASQSILGLDVGWVHVHDLPGQATSCRSRRPGSRARRTTITCRPRTPGAIASIGALTYEDVLGGLTVQPRVGWLHDVGGVSPGPRRRRSSRIARRSPRASRSTTSAAGACSSTTRRSSARGRFNLDERSRFRAPPGQLLLLGTT